MSWNRLSRTLLRLAVVVPLLAISPLTLAPTGEVQENRACAADVCVERINETCILNGAVLRDHSMKRTPS